jgi:dTDP-4-dehydrorhamnose 3,5-epimerase
VFERLAIPDVFLYTPRRHGDARGWFMETFSQATLEPMTGPLAWVQDNHSRSDRAGTVRGLHFQRGASAQDKLVRCVRGEILDVAVDIRPGSPTFGRHVSAVLSEENGMQIFVPKGFAHGFATRVAGTEVQYKVSAPYDPTREGGVMWNDPALGIDWGVAAEDATLSERDRLWPNLKDLPAQDRA